MDRSRDETESPRVLNARVVGRNMKGAVYVGRPSKFGNPFRIGPDGDRESVIKKYAAWITGQPDLVAAAKRELRGRSLICWCAPEGCHADVLLRIANGETARQD